MTKLKFDYLTKDYEAFRTEMINLIPKIMPEWTDYLQSDPGITLIELFAYGLDVLSYYQDRIANEMFLPTAQLRQSVIDYCRPIGYRLSEPSPSKTSVVFEISPGAELTIPKGFVVTTKPEPGEEPVYFELTEALTIPEDATGMEKNGDEYLYTVPVVNGITIQNEIIGSSNGLPNQRFRLRYPSVIEIDTKLVLEVDDGAGFIEWVLRDELFMETDLEKRRYYNVEVDADNFLWIKFGSGIDGKVPEIGTDNIRSTYRIGGGKNTNVGSNTITEIPAPLNRVKDVTNPEPATGGSDRESAEEAKARVPIVIGTRNRAVTRRDFAELPLLIEGVLKSTAEALEDNGVWVVKVVIIAKEEYIAEEVLENVDNYLEEIKILGVFHDTKLVDPVLLDLEMEALIDDEYEQGVLNNLISEVIEDSFQPEYREFGETIRPFTIDRLLSGIKGILGLNITKLSAVPRIIEESISGTISLVDGSSLVANTEKGYWRVTMTSGTEFDVEYDSTGEFDGGEEAKGSGSLDVQFTSIGDEITFTLEGDNLSSGDYIIIEAHPYKGDIEIGKRDIVLFGRFDLTIEGGLSSE